MKNSLYKTAELTIQEAERTVLTVRSYGDLLDIALRSAFFPFLFILNVGMKSLFRPVMKWIIFTLIFTITFLIFDSLISFSAQTKTSLYFLSFYAPIFLVGFAIPSTFVYDGVKESQIQSLADYIYSLGINSEEKIKALNEALNILAQRAYSRARTFQWIVATAWAFFLYAMNQINGIVLKISPEKINDLISNNIKYLILYGLLAIVSIILIVSYKKGIDAVFRRIQLALLELRYRIELKSSVSKKRALLRKS